MTQSEFIKMYCDGSGIEERRLNELGQFAIPCCCGNECCEGWAIISKENIKSHCDLYIKTNLKP